MFSRLLHHLQFHRISIWLSGRMAASERDLTPSWILQDTLNVHRSALDSYLSSKGVTSPPITGARQDEGLTMAVLGCGTMGTAVLGGILDSLGSKAEKTGAQNVAAPERLPSRFVAIVRTASSADRLRKALRQYALSSKVSICQGDADQSVAAVKEADVVLLGCKPQGVKPILTAEAMRDALNGKLVVSMCAGVSHDDLEICLSDDSCDNGGEDASYAGRSSASVVRAMPNTAAAIRESMTVIATPPRPISPSHQLLVEWIFSRLGRVVHLPEAHMDACTALCGSGPAFAAVFLESLATGAIAMGVSRQQAYMMAAQTMRGTTGLLLEGQEAHPAVLRDKITSPGGYTAVGLAVLEEGGMRGVVSKAVKEAAKAAKGE